MPPAASPPPPPGGPFRRPTADFDLLAANVRLLSEELAADRQARKDDKDRGLSVTKLHVPFLMVFVLLSVLVSVGTTAAIFVGSTRAHISNDKIHVDEGAAKARGGVAYTKDIAEAVSDVQAHERASLRAIVKNSPLVCTPLHPGDPGYGRGKTDCKFQEPEIRQ
jgi:hypothetical protein